MSNFDSDEKTVKISEIKWRSIQTELKSALDIWQTIDLQAAPKSPEEIQFEKVKTMIENIKDKLNDF